MKRPVYIGLLLLSYSLTTNELAAQGTVIFNNNVAGIVKSRVYTTGGTLESTIRERPRRLPGRDN